MSDIVFDVELVVVYCHRHLIIILSGMPPCAWDGSWNTSSASGSYMLCHDIGPAVFYDFVTICYRVCYYF